jgi:hypothetical protein
LGSTDGIEDGTEDPFSGINGVIHGVSTIPGADLSIILGVGITEVGTTGVGIMHGDGTTGASVAEIYSSTTSMGIALAFTTHGPTAITMSSQESTIETITTEAPIMDPALPEALET